MPFPAGHKGKGKGSEGASDEGLCGLCGQPVDKEEQPGWIEASCSACGTRGFHFECVSEFMQREVRCMDTRGNKKSDKSLVYARLYPQNIFARNTHIMSRKPVCPGKLGAKDCPGLMDTAELIRPQKEAAADGEPASAPAPAPAPTKKQKPVAAGVLGKASKPSGPLKVAPSRNTSSSVSTAPVGTRVADTGVRPGGGAAAALGGGAAAAPTFAQLQAQEERERKKREREERRAKAAAEAERSTVASTARSTTSDLPEGEQDDVWGSMLGDACPPYPPSDAGPWDPASFGAEPGPAAADAPAHGWPAGAAGAADAEDAALQAAMHASLAEADDDIDAAALAAALRQQQELLQRQWQQAGGRQAIWQAAEPAAPAAAATAAPEPAWEPAVPTPEASAQPVWEPTIKAAPVVDALAPLAPEPAFEPTPQFERPAAPEEEVDELLALMGIS